MAHCPYHPPGEGCSFCPQDEVFKRMGKRYEEKDGWRVYKNCPRDKNHHPLWGTFDLYWCNKCKKAFCSTCSTGVFGPACPGQHFFEDCLKIGLVR